MRPHIEPFCDRDEGFKHLRLPNFANGMHYKMLRANLCGNEPSVVTE